VVFTAVLRMRRHMMQLSLPGPREPHSAVSAVSKSHGVAHITRVPQHHVAIHVLHQPTQICQKQIVGAHEVPNFKHNSPELLIIPSHRGTLPQVKQTGLVTQSMVQVAELRFQRMAKVLPCAISQPCPIFIRYRSPPCQRLPRE
jgi:hypothetical protein